MFNIKDLGERELDKLFAEKFDVSDRTIRNYKKKQDDSNVIKPTGKIHLYKAMYLYMYLTELGTFKNEEGEEESEQYSNAELLMQSIESLESNISLLKQDLQEDIKETIERGIKENLEIIKHISKEILFN